MLGPEHYNVGISLNNLALLFVSQKRYIEAESLYQQAIAICEKALGPDHPYLAAIAENYASLLEKKRPVG
jgi:tetratricopeptide (TPR) repeat protein